MDKSLPLTPVYILRFDGSCPRNPGPMGVGYTLGLYGQGEGQGIVNNSGVYMRPGETVQETLRRSERPGEQTLVRVGAQVGEGTNNIAEYHALIAGLRHAIRLGFWRLHIETDSQLVERQIIGRYKVRDSFLKRLNNEARDLLSLLSSWEIIHIRREENTDADMLSRSQVWEEPTLPPPPVVNGRPRAFQEFQAAFVRHWWRAGIRNSYFLARIFDVAPQQIEAIGNDQSYKGAEFVLPAFADDSLPSLLPVMV